MLADGYLVGDGSWNLRVYVTDLQVERTLRVKGDLHVGGVMLKLVEDLGKFTMKTRTMNTFLDHYRQNNSMQPHHRRYVVSILTASLNNKLRELSSMSGM